MLILYVVGQLTSALVGNLSDEAGRLRSFRRRGQYALH